MDIDEVMNEKMNMLNFLILYVKSNNYLFVCLFVTNILEKWYLCII